MTPSPLTTARHALAATLREAGLPATDHAPTRPDPPAVQVSSLTITTDTDIPYGHRALRARLRVIARPGDPATVLDDLDDLTYTTVTTLEETTSWAVESTGEPYVLVLTDAQSLPAVDVTATTTL